MNHGRKAAGRRPAIFFLHSSDHELYLDRSTATWAVGAMVSRVGFRSATRSVALPPLNEVRTAKRQKLGILSIVIDD